MDQKNSNVAEGYVDSTAAGLTRTFRNTLIVAVIILALECIYFAVLTYKIKDGLTAIPDMVEAYQGRFDKFKEYAEKIPDKTTYANKMVKYEGYLDDINKIEDGEGDVEGMANLISQRVVAYLEEQGDVVTFHSSNFLRQNIDELPEWVKKQIPNYSARLRFRIANWIHQYCLATSDELGTALDTFLDDNADEIKEFSERTDDEDALDKLDEVFADTLVEFMESTSIEDYGTLKSQSDGFLKRLEAANELLHPLASKKTEDLNKQQLRLRTAVALFMDKINNSDLEKN